MLQETANKIVVKGDRKRMIAKLVHACVITEKQRGIEKLLIQWRVHVALIYNG